MQPSEDMQTIQIINEKLTTPKELDRIGVISLVKQWEERKAGRLKCYRIGAKILYSEAHIKAYFALCEQGGNENTGGE
jgi:hypothetical protein